MALTSGNLLFDAQINNEKRSNRIFKDLSLNFNQNPVTKDITKVTDVEAIKRSVRNLISINHYEKPFHPEIGSDIRALLFENMTPTIQTLLTDRIKDVLDTYEPRAVLNDVIVSGDMDLNQYGVTIKFYVREVPGIQIVTEFLQRLR